MKRWTCPRATNATCRATAWVFFDQEIRVLAHGDSFTYGLGVEEHDTYVGRTERILRARRRPDFPRDRG